MLALYRDFVVARRFALRTEAILQRVLRNGCAVVGLCHVHFLEKQSVKIRKLVARSEADHHSEMRWTGKSRRFEPLQDALVQSIDHVEPATRKSDFLTAGTLPHFKRTFWRTEQIPDVQSCGLGNFSGTKRTVLQLEHGGTRVIRCAKIFIHVLRIFNRTVGFSILLAEEFAALYVCNLAIMRFVHLSHVLSLNYMSLVPRQCQYP